MATLIRTLVFCFLVATVAAESTECPTRCSCNDSSWTCNGLLSLQDLTATSHPEVQVLHVSQSHFIDAELDVLRKFPNLQNLSLVENKLWRHASKPFPPLPSLLFLNLSHNALATLDVVTYVYGQGDVNLAKEVGRRQRKKYVGTTARNKLPRGTEPPSASLLVTSDKSREHLLTNVGQIVELHVTHNNLSTLSHDVLAPCTQLAALDLSGNPWECDSRMHWLVEFRVTLLNEGDAVCHVKTALRYFPITKVLPLQKRLREQCPKSCKCELLKIPRIATEDRYPTAIVNCSGRGLRDLPNIMPINMSVTLDVSHNQISSLGPLVTKSEVYAQVPIIYADFNQMESIAVLEGSTWIQTFSLLSVQGNSLTQLPTQALDAAFQQNRNGIRIYLGKNPWLCDCDSTTNLQWFMAKYPQFIFDIGNVRCADKPGDINSLQKVNSVPRQSVCPETQDSELSYFDILNITLALLTIGVITKLVYDYWSFKKTGRLPWIVAKMP